MKISQTWVTEKHEFSAGTIHLELSWSQHAQQMSVLRWNRSTQHCCVTLDRKVQQFLNPVSNRELGYSERTKGIHFYRLTYTEDLVIVILDHTFKLSCVKSTY